MIEKMKEIPIQKIRLFLLIIICSVYAVSYITYPTGSYSGSMNHLMVTINILISNTYFTYQVQEYPLKIHKLIEDKIKGEPSVIYLRIILLLALISGVGAYFSIKNMSNLNYLSKENFAFQLIILLLSSSIASFWERRKKLKNN